MDWDPSAHRAAQNYHFLTSAVAPRPIAWVTTTDPSGIVNAAPFSWFMSICADPMLLAISVGDRAGGPKDTARNALASGEFVVNVVTEAVAKDMVASSADYPPDQSEVDALGLPTVPSVRVKPPRLARCPVAFECRTQESHRYGRGAAGTTLLVGEVVHIHADDALLDERGNLRNGTPLLARLGGTDYVVVRETLRLERPRPPA